MVKDIYPGSQTSNQNSALVLMALRVTGWYCQLPLLFLVMSYGRPTEPAQVRRC